jgi:TonB family protein
VNLPNSFDSVATLLIACTVKATIVLGAALLFTGVFRRRSAAFRHSIWAAAILGTLALPLLTLIMPAWRSAALGNAAAVFEPRHTTIMDGSGDAAPAMAVNAILASPAIGKWSLWVLLLWAVGAFAFLIRIALGFAGLRRLFRQSNSLAQGDLRLAAAEISEQLGIRRAVRLRQANQAAAMPVTWGAIQPTILLPASAPDWPNVRKRSVLMHEMAHVARLDWFFQVLAEFLRAIYWFHPFSWMAAAKLRRESERSCDDFVLNSGMQAREYAKQLIELAGSLNSPSPSWSSALAVARRTNLERRFTAMLQPSMDRRSLSRGMRIFLPLTAALVLVPLAAVRLPAQNTVMFGGTISDPSGLPIANATIVLSNHATNQIQMTTSNREGKYTFVDLPAGEYGLRVMKEGFAELRAKIMADGPRNDEAAENFTLQVAPANDEIDVIAHNEVKGGVSGGVSAGVGDGAGRGVGGGVKGGVNDGVGDGVKTNDSKKTIRIRIGGDVQAAKIVQKVQPVYPDAARTAGIDGTVILHAVIGMDGTPLSLKVMNNQIDPDLAKAAVEAVSKWRYQPTLLNGDPIEVDTTIMVKFTLMK